MVSRKPHPAELRERAVNMGDCPTLLVPPEWRCKRGACPASVVNAYPRRVLFSNPSFRERTGSHQYRPLPSGAASWLCRLATDLDRFRPRRRAACPCSLLLPVSWATPTSDVSGLRKHCCGAICQATPPTACVRKRSFPSSGNRKGSLGPGHRRDACQADQLPALGWADNRRPGQTPGPRRPLPRWRARDPRTPDIAGS